MTSFTINVREDRKCAECRKGFATDSGLCLTCVAKATRPKPMSSAVGRAVQQRMRNAFAETPKMRPFEVLSAAAMGEKK